MSSPARLPETTALIDALRADGYGDREHDDFIDSLFEHPDSYPENRKVPGDSWEAPGGVVIPTGAHDRYLHELVKPQARAIIAIQDQIGQGKLGQALLENARLGGVQYGFSTTGDVAHYNVAQRRLLFNNRPDFTQPPPVVIAQAAAIGAHELTHTQQTATMMAVMSDVDASIENLAVPLKDRILLTRHMEAAANAMAAQIAFDNVQLGDTGIWHALAAQQNEDEELSSFTKAVQADRASGHDGRARLAAHNAFFSRQQYMGAYDDREIKIYTLSLKRLAEQQALGFPEANDRDAAQKLGTRLYSADELRLMAAMPDGINHLTVAGAKDPKDDQYTAFTSDKHAGQVAYLTALADRLRQDQTVSVEMVEAVRDVTHPDQAATMMADIAALDGPIAKNIGDRLSGWRRKRGGGHPNTPPPKP